MVRLKRVALFLIFVLAVHSAAAYAQGTALTDEQVQQRLAFISKALDQGQPGARRWWYGWMGAYTAGAAAAGVLVSSHWHDTKLEGSETVPDRELAEGMLVGGATFVLGVGGLLIDPFSPASAARKLGRLPEATPQERLAKLGRAEELLRKCAAREKRGRNLTTHLLNLGANAAGAVALKFGFDQTWGNALVSFATGEAVSLLNIFTQPTRAVRDLKKYEAGFAAGEPALRPKASWSLGFFPGGLSFRLSF